MPPQLTLPGLTSVSKWAKRSPSGKYWIVNPSATEVGDESADLLRRLMAKIDAETEMVRAIKPWGTAKKRKRNLDMAYNAIESGLKDASSTGFQGDPSKRLMLALGDNGNPQAAASYYMPGVGRMTPLPDSHAEIGYLGSMVPRTGSGMLRDIQQEQHDAGLGLKITLQDAFKANAEKGSDFYGDLGFRPWKQVYPAMQDPLGGMKDLPTVTISDWIRGTVKQVPEQLEFEGFRCGGLAAMGRHYGG